MSLTSPPVRGCNECRSAYGALMMARSELARAKRVLRGARDATMARYVEEGKAAREAVNVQQVNYDAHLADSHPISITLPGTDNDRAPSHHKPALPPAAEIAARLQAGELLDDVAAQYERTTKVISRKVSMAGFNGTTGEPRRVRRDEDGLPIPMQVWAFPPWVEDALCSQTDPEVFFPEKGGSTREAKKVCAVCPARLKCLQWSLDNDERYGVYGGLSERERRALKKAAS